MRRRLLCVIGLVGATMAPAFAAEKVVIGYVFAEDKPLVGSEIAATKLTHINYAFANIKSGRMVEGFKDDAANFQALTALKARNPRLKVLVSVGGWTWSGNFSDMALTRESRKRFIESAVEFLNRYQLDGLDVDWEFPGQKGLNNTNRPEDRENSTALLAELRAALDIAGRKAGKRYLLTMATEASDEWLDHTEMGKAQASLDFVNLMAYDQFGADEDAITGHHAPLFTNPANPKKNSAATSIDHYLAAGVPAGKLVLGVPFYGKAWGDVPATEHGLYQPGGRTHVKLDTSFGAISRDLENKNGFARQWDDVSKAAYLYNADRKIFITYEDERSVREKARFVMDRGLGGIMFWEYSEDPENKLLDAINGVFRAQGVARNFAGRCDEVESIARTYLRTRGFTEPQCATCLSSLVAPKGLVDARGNTVGTSRIRRELTDMSPPFWLWSSPLHGVVFLFPTPEPNGCRLRLWVDFESLHTMVAGIFPGGMNLGVSSNGKLEAEYLDAIDGQFRATR